MAITLLASPTFTATLNAANTYQLPAGSSGPTSPVSRWVIEITNSGTFNGTLIVKARLAGNNGTFVAVPYVNLFLNGSVGTGALVSTNLSTGAMTGGSLIEVDASEMEVAVDCTSFTSGSATMTARLIQG